MRIYQFYTTSSQANAASIQMLRRGRIVAVTWVVSQDGATDNTSVQAELSFQSSSMFSTHNAQGVISACYAAWINAIAAGTHNGSLNFLHAVLNIPVNVLDTVYLNTSITVGAATIKALMHVEE